MAAEDKRSVSSLPLSEDGVWCECNKKCYYRLFCSVNMYWRTLGLSTVLIVYLLVGAAIFSSLERPSELDENRKIQESNTNHSMMLEELVVLLVNNTNMTREQSISFITAIATAAANADLPQTNDWKYGSSLFFSMTVVTTIGYGTIAPTTTGGRRFFIVYALIGIPITLVVLASIGDILNKVVTWLSHPVHKKLNKVKAKVVVTIGFLVGGLLLFVIIPAIIFFIIQEDWTYSDSVYYCFVTLTTVGFGDFVPGLNGSSDLNGLYRVCVGVWIFIGLAFLSLVISLIQELFKKLTKKVRKAKCKCLPVQTGGKNTDQSDHGSTISLNKGEKSKSSETCSIEGTAGDKGVESEQEMIEVTAS